MSIQSVKESIPMSLLGDEATAASVVIDRRSVKVQPVTGNNYSSQGQRDITFRLSGREFADFSNLSLFCKLKTDSINTYPDDLFTSIIQRVQVYINGVLLEDLDNCADVARVITYIGTSKNYYENELHNYGAWKYVRSKASARSTEYNECDFPISLTQGNEFGDGAARAGKEICIPLNFLGLTRGYNSETKLFPLRNMQEVQITVTLAQAHHAMIMAKATDVATMPTAQSVPSYTVDDPFLVFQSVQLDQGFYQAFDNMLVTKGWRMYFDSFYAVRKQIADFPSNHNISLSISRSDIRALYCVFRPSFLLSQNGVIYPKSNYYGGSLFKSASLQIGDTVMPAHRIESTAQAWYHLQACMNKMNHQGSGSVIDSDAYSGYDRRQLNVADITVANDAYHPIANTATYPDTVGVQNPGLYYPSCFVLGFSTQKAFDTNATVSLGADTLNTASHMVLSVDMTALASMSAAGKARSELGTLTNTATTWEMLVIADTSRTMAVVDQVVQVTI